MAAKKKLSRDQKRTRKKAKRASLPSRERSLLPTPDLFQPLHRAGWDNYTIMPRPPQTEKMSEVLWEFLAPYMPLAPDREAVEKLLTMAIAAPFGRRLRTCLSRRRAPRLQPPRPVQALWRWPAACYVSRWPAARLMVR
jgi:hypothetical protein